MYVHNLFHFACPKYLQVLCMMEFDPLPTTHTHSFIYLYNVRARESVCVCVCVCVRAHNGSPILSKMLSKECPYLAVPQIRGIVSGIKILKKCPFLGTF